MRAKPTWQKGVVVYLIYNVIIFGTWAAVGLDYNNMVGSDVIMKSLVLPLSLGAIFLIAALTWLGWWRPVMTETHKARPGWTMWPIMALMAGFILVNASTTNWSAITGIHLLLMICATESALAHIVMPGPYERRSVYAIWNARTLWLFRGSSGCPKSKSHAPLAS